MRIYVYHGTIGEMISINQTRKILIIYCKDQCLFFKLKFLTSRNEAFLMDVSRKEHDYYNNKPKYLRKLSAILTKSFLRYHKYIVSRVKDSKVMFQEEKETGLVNCQQGCQTDSLY